MVSISEQTGSFREDVNKKVTCIQKKNIQISGKRNEKGSLANMTHSGYIEVKKCKAKHYVTYIAILCK